MSLKGRLEDLERATGGQTVIAVDWGERTTVDGEERTLEQLAALEASSGLVTLHVRYEDERG